ncbi:hypothetical protein BGZ94_003253 [Podila epigama]|nr:hypothetical protein BGZ94_003253 [Podila epigama]
MSTAIERPTQNGNGLNRKTSRKGKKAWRKNVDIAEIEENLSELRDEERTTGGKVHQSSNDALFTLDTKGDGKVIKELRKNRPLKMDEILAERSKIPAVSGRTRAVSVTAPLESAGQKPNAKISKAEKARLLAMIRKKTSSSLFADTKKPLGRSGMTDAVKAAGTFDVWGAATDSNDHEDESKEEDGEDFVAEIVTKVSVKAPKSFKQKPKVAIPAVKESHPGASYNPTMQDHQSLLRLAHNEELRLLEAKEKIEAKLAYPKELDNMIAFDDQTGGLLENTDDEDEDEEEEEEDETKDESSVKTKKAKGKKSIAERNRLARAAETLKKEAEIRRHKELIKQTNRVKEIMKSVEEEEAEMEKRRLEQEEKKMEKEKSESLRELKPEGSLMKDRFQSFVERNLIEPRMPVAKRRRYRLKTYEKHSYKRFDNPNHA